MRKNSLDKEQLKITLTEQLEQFRKQDLGTRREKLEEITKYQKSPHAVVISGLRRVGKSTLLAQIADKFHKNEYYFINFEDERLLNFETRHFVGLQEVLVELFGEKRIFFLDEVQNVKGWERFVRRLLDQDFKIYLTGSNASLLTGSNASLLSGELGTKLTGRYIPIELFPFSFREFLRFRRTEPGKIPLTTIGRAKLKRMFNQYLFLGGIPDGIKYRGLPVHKTLYDDVLHRDIAARYQIEKLTALRELTFYLISNISCLISYNKLKNLLKLGSVNTVKNYIGYLETSWLMSVMNVYAYSVKKQQIAAKKIYAIDTGLVNSVAFSFSKNAGKYLENSVYLGLRQRYKNLYYYKTEKGQEVDFYIPEGGLFIQVCQSLADEETKERELQSLMQARKERPRTRCLVLTESEKGTIKLGREAVQIKPVWEWWLEN